MADGHDDAAVGLGGDLQLVLGEALTLDGERVVAGRIEGVGQAVEDAGTLVADEGGLAVEDLARAGDGAAERLADGLVAQTDAEDGQLAGEVADERDADACLLRRAGAGGDDDALRDIASSSSTVA